MEAYRFVIPSPRRSIKQGSPTTTNYIKPNELLTRHSTPISMGGTPDVPLRHRKLPASFWKEPNVPNVSYPTHLPSVTPRCHVLDKCDVDKFRAAQIYGQNPTRFPITEFLYYNYGVKNAIDATINDGPKLHPIHRAHSRTPHVHTTTSGIACKCCRPSFDISSGRLNFRCVSHTNTCSSLNVKSNPEQCHSVDASIQNTSFALWKPIPTKNSSIRSARFHPFASGP